MGSGGKERLKKEPSHFFQPHSEFKSVTTGLGMVSLSAGAVFLTHPSEVHEDQAGQGEGEHMWSKLWVRERQLCMAVSGECALSVWDLI